MLGGVTSQTSHGYYWSNDLQLAYIEFVRLCCTE